MTFAATHIGGMLESIVPACCRHHAFLPLVELRPRRRATASRMLLLLHHYWQTGIGRNQPDFAQDQLAKIEIAAG